MPVIDGQCDLQIVGPWGRRGPTGFFYAIDAADVARKLAEFEGIWHELSPAERCQPAQFVLAHIEYSARNRISVTCRTPLR